MHVELAHHDRARGREPFDHGSVDLWNEVLVNFRSAGCRDATRQEQVFERYRDSMQWTAIVLAGQFLVRMERLIERLPARHQEERIEPRIEPLDALERGGG